MLLLKQSSKTASSIFIRTDQLDGETDWKPRKPLPQTQATDRDHDLLEVSGHVLAKPPTEEIYGFTGYYENAEGQKEPLSLENTMWQNTVLASQGHVYGLVMYTGKETRSNMSSKVPRSKLGLLD